MPNPVDVDRMESRQGGATIIDLDAVRAAKASAYGASVTQAASSSPLVMILLACAVFWLFFRFAR